MLSDEALFKYHQMEPLKRIRSMIDDSVDTDIIMTEVRAFGEKRYNNGVQDAISRMSNRPGDGDMGG